MSFKDGNLQGPSKKYSPDGKLLIDAQYKNNQFDGIVQGIPA